MPKVLKITSMQFLWNISRQKSLKSRVRWSSLTYIYHQDFHMLLDYHFMLLYWWFGEANYLPLVLLFTSWLKWRKKVRTPFWGFGKLLKKKGGRGRKGIFRTLSNISDKVFKSGLNKFCGRQPLKKLKGYGLLKGCLPQNLHSPLSNTLSHN